MLKWIDYIVNCLELETPQPLTDNNWTNPRDHPVFRIIIVLSISVFPARLLHDWNDYLECFRLLFGLFSIEPIPNQKAHENVRDSNLDIRNSSTSLLLVIELITFQAPNEPMTNESSLVRLFVSHTILKDTGITFYFLTGMIFIIPWNSFKSGHIKKTWNSIDILNYFRNITWNSIWKIRAIIKSMLRFRGRITNFGWVT